MMNRKEAREILRHRKNPAWLQDNNVTSEMMAEAVNVAVESFAWLSGSPDLPETGIDLTVYSDDSAGRDAEYILIRDIQTLMLRGKCCYATDRAVVGLMMERKFDITGIVNLYQEMFEAARRELNELKNDTNR